MSNKHRLEKLRLAEAPDETMIWTKTPLPKAKWVLPYAVSWSSKCKYVVDDGFFVEERKHFAEHGEIYYYSSSMEEWVKYSSAPPTPKWYELKSNIGKIILVSNDNIREEAQIYRKLTRYLNKSFYTSMGDVWPYAWLINPGELAKESPDV